MSTAEVRTVLVPDGLAGERADAGVARMFGLSRSRVADLCAEGNGRAAHAVFGVDHVAAGRISVS